MSILAQQSSADGHFLERNPEDLRLAQYWYSRTSIETLVEDIQQQSRLGVAFLSTPSLYFSLTDPDLRAKSRLFEVSKMLTQEACLLSVALFIRFVDFNGKKIGR